MIKHWYDIPEAKRKTIQILAKSCQWKHIYNRHNEWLRADSKEHVKQICHWLRDQNWQPDIEDKTDPTFIHNKSYWFDAEREVYVLHLPSHKRPFVLRASVWQQMKEAYSNWDGSPASVNEMARKFAMSRSTVKEVLRAMGHTHDGSPWPDEMADKADEADLIEDLLQSKLQNVVTKAERIEWNKVKKDASKWRRLDLVSQEMERRFQTHQQQEIPLLHLPDADDKYIAVISPTDFHWGKYASEMTGDPYNRDIARERLFSTTKEILRRVVKRGRPEKIVVALGGDGLHFDTYQKKTTMGTPQDADGTPEEIAWTWIELCRDYICMVAQVAPVELFVIPGNHDRFTSVFLRAAMKGWFHNISCVSVVEILSPRQYMKYGKSMIGFLHGDIGKVSDWPAIMAGEEPEMWGQTKHKFIFTGHYHTERELPTFGNVTVYRMPSLAGTDLWHHNSGYKSRKALVCYIIDETKGVIGTELEPVV